MVKRRIFIFVAMGMMAFFIGMARYHSTPKFKDIDGHTINFHDEHNRWVVLNYWASWCKPCIKEIPELNSFYQAHRNKDAIVVGVNVDHVSGIALNEIIAKMNVKFPTLKHDPAAKLGIKHIEGLPATFIVAPNGKVAKQIYGAQTQEKLEKAIGLPPQEMFA